MKLVKTCALGALALGMISCGALDGKKSGKKLDETNPLLSGIWKTDCHSQNFLELGHTIKKYDFNVVGDFTRTEDFYTDSDCGSKAFSYVTEGTVADLDNNDRTRQHDVNLTVTKHIVTPHSDTLVKALNKLELCGKSDWTEGGRVQVDGKKCAEYFISEGSVVFDILRKEGDTMYFGKTSFLGSKDKADQRPTNLDRKVGYHKQ